MNYLSDNIDDNLKTSNPKAHHWREMYLRQVELYKLMLDEKDKIMTAKEDKYEKMLAEKEDKYKKLLAEKEDKYEKLLAEKDKQISIQDNFIFKHPWLFNR